MLRPVYLEGLEVVLLLLRTHPSPVIEVARSLRCRNHDALALRRRKGQTCGHPYVLRILDEGGLVEDEHGQGLPTACVLRTRHGLHPRDLSLVVLYAEILLVVLLALLVGVEQELGKELEVLLHSAEESYRTGSVVGNDEYPLVQLEQQAPHHESCGDDRETRLPRLEYDVVLVFDEVGKGVLLISETSHLVDLALADVVYVSVVVQKVNRITCASGEFPYLFWCHCNKNIL